MKLTNGHRTAIAQFVIAGALCGAAYHFLVEPAKRSLVETRAKVSRMLSESGQDPAAATITPAQIDAIRADCESRAAQITRRSAPARNEALMFAGVSALAGKRNIRVEQVQPTSKGKSHNSAAAPASPPPPAPGSPDAAAQAAAVAAAPKMADTSVAYSIVALGSYADLTGFVSDLAHNLGFTVVTGLRVSVVGDEFPDQVRADITTEHFAFDIGGSVQVPAIASVPASGVAGGGKP